jgi:hypothetical protein
MSHAAFCKIAIFLFFLYSSCRLGYPCEFQTAPSVTGKLDTRVPHYSADSSNFPGARIQVSNDFHIPMGIVCVDSKSKRTQNPLSWNDATVREIIEGVAKSREGYEVQVKNGIVHICPSTFIPTRQNFLKIKIPSFETHDTYIEVATWKLHELLDPHKGNLQVSIGGSGDSRVTVQIKDSLVEDILDALAEASNRKIWVVTFVDDGGVTSRGFRRTVSLWSKKPGPDEGEPSWDWLRWDDPLPPRVAATPQPETGGPR